VGCRSLLGVTVAGVPALRRFCLGGFDVNGDLVRLDIPKEASEIGDRAFEGCGSLKTVSFEAGSSLKRIGVCAFRGCAMLECMEIPSGVAEIGLGAFCGCRAFRGRGVLRSRFPGCDTYPLGQ
jgi:hypothetical protein